MRILIVILFTLCLFACKDESSSSVNTDAELHIAIKRDPVRLSPLLSNIQRSRQVFQSIFLPLADFDPSTLELKPILAKDIPQKIKLTSGPYEGKVAYTFQMRADAKWDDGVPVTGADYIFTQKAIKHPETGAGGYRSYMTHIIDAAIDDKDGTVTIIFDEDYMLSLETVATMDIYPKHIYDPNGYLDNVSLESLSNPKEVEKLIQQDSTLSIFAQEFNSVKYSRDIVSGSGPYKLVDWVADQTIVLERKENYWGDNSESPYLQNGPQRIIFHVIPDELNIINQLKAGEIDVFPSASATAYAEIASSESYSDKFSLFTPELMKTYYILMNNDQPELADKSARRALAHLMDVEEVITLLEGGLAKPAAGLINPKKVYFDKSIKPVKIDIAKAKEILKETGWADTNSDGTIDKKIEGKQQEFELDMYTTGSNLSNKIALILSENAKEAGIKINIIQKKYSQFKKENLATGKFDLITQSVTQSPAADDPYAKWHSDNDKPSGTNVSRYNNPKMDEVIEDIRAATSASDRSGLYKQLQEIMYEDQPVIWLYHPTEKMILSKEWNGVATSKRPGYMPNTFTPAR